MRKYKFIMMKQVDNEVFEEKPVYRVFNNKTKEQIGMISWYKRWRHYVFSTKENMIFDAKCLSDITDFMKDLK